MHNPVLENRVAQLYNDQLPYHNFGHALSVVEAGEEIAAAVMTKGSA